MEFVRKAGADEVIASVGTRPRGTLPGDTYSVWDFSTDDVESIVGRLPGTSYDAPLCDLAPAWRTYLQKDVVLLSRYQRAIGALIRTGALVQRPVLYAVPSRRFACYIGDELEQLFAALDFAAPRLAFTIEVFWSDRGSEQFLGPAGRVRP